MRLVRPRVIALVLAVLALGGCARARRTADWAVVREVTPDSLAGTAARDPALAADGTGRVALAYVTPARGGGQDLWLAVSRDSGATFGARVRVNATPGRVAPAADGRAALAWGADGRLALAWSECAADSSRAVDLRVRVSGDGGATFGAAVVVNDDSLGPPALHGSPALAFVDDGVLALAWRDGRTRAAEDSVPLAALFVSSTLDGGRTWRPNALVSDSLVATARPALTGAGGRLALAWWSAVGGTRAPVVAFSADSGRTFGPELALAADRGPDDGGLADGPVLAGTGEGGVAVWGAGAAGLRLAPWAFGRGASGAPSALLDSLARAGHGCVVAQGEVTWLAAEAVPRGDSVAVIATRALEAGGTRTPWLFLGAHARDAALAPLSPRLALVAWVEGDAAHPRVRLARVARVSGR